MKFVPLLLSLVAIFPTASLVAAERPNVLLLFIDDLKPMTRDYGHEHMETPNFDRLAESGLRFENAYCQVPTCGASRASLMTSLYPTFRRFPDFLTRAERDAPDQPTLPQRFKEAGYITLSNGKVFHHLDDTDIRSWSEPAWRPETSGKTFHNRETIDFIDKSTVLKASKGKPVKKVTMFEKSRVSPLESHDGLVAARTMEDLKRLAEGDKPFFLACGFAKPHMPFYSPEASWSPYPLNEIDIADHRERPVPTPLSMRQVKEQFAYLPMTHDLSRELEYNSDEYHRHMRQGYYASVTHADDLTGRILDQLEELDLDRNTIVVAVGDHGWLLGEHNEWAKNQLLHEALRTAMWMKGPGISKGAEVNTFVEFVDIHPTLCELAGISYEGDSINGKSFAPVLKDPTANHRDNAYTRFEHGDALTSKDHYYVRWRSKAHGEEALLIDRQKDEGGMHNVAADPAYAGAVKALGSQLDDKINEALDLPKPPRVAETPIDLFASVSGPKLNGVVLSHGGLRTGYALHFNKGIPTLSVRNGGELFTLSASAPVKGNVNLAARIGPKKLVLTVNGKSIEGPPSKLLKGQPVGRFSLGSDPGDPVGDYEGKQPFSGTIRTHRVVVGASPGEAVKNLNSATREIPDPPDTPNIVMILADDCTFTDLGVYGGQAKTPHLEALAKSGMKFENCFQAAPMCSPTRHNLYTGIYPVKSGAYPNHTFVKPGIKSIAHYLKEQGYRVALTGKTHVSPREAFPFEYSFIRGGKHREPDFDATDRLISESKASGTPFCQIICSNEPHSPHTKGPRDLYPLDKIVLPEYHVDTPETREAYRNYFAEITFFDGQVGRVMKQLEKHNMVDNTVLIVLSEQGSAFPFAKWTCYDAGLRSGMIVRWPGKVAPGSTSNALVEYVDILPTLLEVAESEVPDVLEGRSLLPVLEGRSDHHKDHVFGLMTTRGINSGAPFYGIRSVRSAQYHLIRNLTPESEFRNVILNTDYFNSWKALADEGKQDAKRWVNRYSKRPEYELYEPAKDPLEINNLIDHPEVAEVKEELIQRLESWMTDQGDLGQATEMAAPTRMTRPPKSKAL
ncbi:MAG: sulfatase-like hydrolase/transferase [Verrucomicrobiales bacterium]|nr:sulfatase-like hydrolase/transferase [Verrucomicrobiales bacterium]